jgi:hypothetical protein
MSLLYDIGMIRDSHEDSCGWRKCSICVAIDRIENELVTLEGHSSARDEVLRDARARLAEAERLLYRVSAPTASLLEEQDRAAAVAEARAYLASREQEKCPECGSSEPKNYLGRCAAYRGDAHGFHTNHFTSREQENKSREQDK